MSEVPRFQYDWTRDPNYMSHEQAKENGYRWNAASERWQRLASVKDEPKQQERPQQFSQAVAPRPAPNPHEDVLTFGKREEFYVRGGSANEILNQLFTGLAGFQQATPNPQQDTHRAYDGPAVPHAAAERRMAPPTADTVVHDHMADEYIPGVIVDENDEPTDELEAIQQEQEVRDAAKQERKKSRKIRFAKKLAVFVLSTQAAYGGLAYATGSSDYFITPDKVKRTTTNLVDMGTNFVNVGKTIGGIFG